MKSRILPALLLGTFLGCVGGLSGGETAGEDLLRNSPFGARETGPVAAPAAAPLEFRGYFGEGHEQFFSIYNPASKRSYWLRRDQAEGALVVRQFDPSQQNLSVEYQGGRLLLPLKKTVVSAIVPVAASPSVTPAAGGAPVSAAIRQAEENLAKAREREAYDQRRRAVAEKLRLARATQGARK